MQKLYLLVALARWRQPRPRAARPLGRRSGAHAWTILGVLVATVASLLVFVDVMGGTLQRHVYTWARSARCGSRSAS